MTAMRMVYTFSDGANTPYSGWVPLMFGAADGFDAETELNMVLWSAWSANSAMGLMLSALYVAQRDVNNEYYFCNNNYGNVGLLWKGANAEKFPPEGPTATGRARLRPAWSAPASPCAMSSGG